MIYITGASGYLASNIARHLGGLGFKVTALSRHQATHEQCIHPNVCVSLLDYARIYELDPIRFEDSVLIHAASPSSAQLESNPLLLDVVSIQDTILYEYALSRKIRHVIYLSSVQVYGSSLSGCVHASDLPQPSSLYAHLNYNSETYLRKAYSGSRLSTSILRLSNVFGSPLPYCHHSWDLFIHDIIKQAVSTSFVQVHSSRFTVKDFVPMRHFLSCLTRILCADAFSSGTNTYNICTGYTRTLMSISEEVAQTVRKLFDKEVSIESSNNTPQPYYSLEPSALSCIASIHDYKQIFRKELISTAKIAVSLFSNPA